MSEFMQYSEEWKQEIKKLPKTTIVEIASQMGIEKQNEINVLKQQKRQLLEVLEAVVDTFKAKTNRETDVIWEVNELIDKISK